MTNYAIELTSLHKSFGTVTAVDGLDLRVGHGEIVALLGPNGAGKTTTLDMLLDLSRPDSGAVRLFGRFARGDRVRPGGGGAASGGLLKDLTIAETVRLVARCMPPRAPPRMLPARAGIADIADRMVGKCSGGQQQGYGARAPPDPDLLGLDEPTTGMDVEGRRSFWQAMRADSARGRTSCSPPIISTRPTPTPIESC